MWGGGEVLSSHDVTLDCGTHRPLLATTPYTSRVAIVWSHILDDNGLLASAICSFSDLELINGLVHPSKAATCYTTWVRPNGQGQQFTIKGETSNARIKFSPGWQCKGKIFENSHLCIALINVFSPIHRSWISKIVIYRYSLSAGCTLICVSSSRMSINNMSEHAEDTYYI